MTVHEFRHPVASLWQEVVNAVEVPPRAEQRDLSPVIPVLARYVWALDGVAWLGGTVIAVWDRRGHEPAVLVHREGHDPRAQTRGVWLLARDVIPVGAAG